MSGPSLCSEAAQRGTEQAGPLGLRYPVKSMIILLHRAVVPFLETAPAAQHQHGHIPESCSHHSREMPSDKITTCPACCSCSSILHHSCARTHPRAAAEQPGGLAGADCQHIFNSTKDHACLHGQMQVSLPCLCPLGTLV